MMTSYLAWVEDIQATPGVKFGIPAIDKFVTPMRPGELTAIVGRPGSGKSTLLAYLARQEAKRIIQRGKVGQEVVVYVTWEQSAEELTAMFLAGDQYSISDVAWGRVDLDTVRHQVVKGAGTPIWTIGHGISRAGTRPPRMTPRIILDAIETMEEDFNVKPVLMLFDYLQLIPVENAKDRIQQVTEVPILIKELALRIGCPAIAAAQARREVDDRDEKLPTARDCQWSSAIEQTVSKLFSVWRPGVTEQAGSIIKLQGGKTYPVNDQLFIIRMLKQRGEQGRHTWAMYFHPAYLRLAELETRLDLRRET